MRLGPALLALATACGPRAAPPELTGVSPPIVCGAGTVELTLTGRNFTPLPTETLAGHPSLIVPAVSLLASGPPLFPTHVRWDSESQLTATVALDALTLAAYDVTVTDPDAQSSTLPRALARSSGGGLAITGVSPPSVCAGAVVLSTRGLEPGATLTIVDGNQQPVLAPPATVSGQTLSFVVARGSLPPGLYQARVQNPASASCAAAASAPLTVTTGPTIANVAPSKICASGGTLMLTGDGFVASATVTLSGAGLTLDAGRVTVADARHATAVFAAGGFAKNTQVDLTLATPDGCASTLPGAVRITSNNGNCP